MMNESSTQIKELVASLFLVSICSTRVRIRTHSEELARNIISKEEMENMDSVLITFLKIPPTIPSSLNLCEILEIKYEVRVTARLGGLHLNQTISLPCTIGSIPLGAVPKEGIHTNRFEDYEMEPPTYEEATFMTAGKRAQGNEMVGDTKFVPLVPTFEAMFSQVYDS